MVTKYLTHSIANAIAFHTAVTNVANKWQASCRIPFGMSVAGYFFMPLASCINLCATDQCHIDNAKVYGLLAPEYFKFRKLFLLQAPFKKAKTIADQGFHGFILLIPKGKIYVFPVPLVVEKIDFLILS